MKRLVGYDRNSSNNNMNQQQQQRNSQMSVDSNEENDALNSNQAPIASAYTQQQQVQPFSNGFNKMNRHNNMLKNRRQLDELQQ